MKNQDSNTDDWKSAFAQRTAEGFAGAFAQDIVLEATVLNMPVRGQDSVKQVLAAATDLYKSVQFTHTSSARHKQYLEWIAEAHNGVKFKGVTALTRDPAGLIIRSAIHHR